MNFISRALHNQGVFLYVPVSSMNVYQRRIEWAGWDCCQGENNPIDPIGGPRYVVPVGGLAVVVVVVAGVVMEGVTRWTDEGHPLQGYW